MTTKAGMRLVKASVVLPTYEDWESVAVCLEALKAQDLPLSEFEVIIVNNNKTSDVPRGLPLHTNMRVIWAPTPGSYAARNVGITKALGEYVFFIDSDCKPSRSWISKGLAAFDANPDCQRIAGSVDVVPANGIWNGWSLCDSVFNLRQEDYVKKGFAVTANLAIRRALVDRVGPFREQSFSGEDKEWNKRASASGIRLDYLADMSVSHPARDTFHACAQKKRRFAGARYVAKSGRRIAQCMPRLHYIFPSPAAFLKIWRHPVDLGFPTRLAAMWCHYSLGWIYNIEVLRLGIFGGRPKR